MDLYVANLNIDIEETALLKLFEVFGEVESAILIRDKESKESKGYGFVKMLNEDEAKLAIEDMHGRVIADRSIVVRIANPKSPESTQKTGNYSGNESYGSQKNSYELVTSAINKQSEDISTEIVDKMDFTTEPAENGLIKVKFS